MVRAPATPYPTIHVCKEEMYLQIFHICVKNMRNTLSLFNLFIEWWPVTLMKLADFILKNIFKINNKEDHDTSQYANLFLANCKNTRTLAKGIVIMPLLSNLKGHLLGR